MKFKLLLFLNFCLLLSGCQPMDFIVPQDGEFSKSRGIEELSFRGEEEFKDLFVSDTLDLVFVLDSQPGMDKFYEDNIFGEEFLSGLEAYDWKVGYTNTSVDAKLLEGRGRGGEEESCGLRDFLSGVGLTLLGGAVDPSATIASFGIYSIANCLSSISFKKSYPKVNGEFLPFEFEGEKSDNQLTKNDEDYEAVFQYTVTKNTGDDYDAPINQGESSAPLSSVFLSLTRGEESFFREESQIVYVVVTPVDAHQDISVKGIKKKFAGLYGRADRLHIIPVIINGEDSDCEMEMKELGVENPQEGFQLTEIASEMNMKSLNLCSDNLGLKLQEQIQPLLYPENFLL